jgi:two-component system phosphate regulon response regulator PhoB
MTSRILVVDDEKDLVNLVRYNLEKNGYEIFCTYDGLSVQDMVLEHQPHLIILDLMLPDRSGYDICRDLKENPATKHIPIIMLTARSSEYNRVTGFECGVEDYVVKPFSPRELMLRVKVILARTLKPIEACIQVGTIQIFPSEHRVLIDDQEVSLTQTEFKILLALAEQPNRVKSREQLLTEVWADEAEEVLDRTVDALMKRLRAKLGGARNAIETVRGVGYKLVTNQPALSLAGAGGTHA